MKPAFPFVLAVVALMPWPAGAEEGASQEAAPTVLAAQTAGANRPAVSGAEVVEGLQSLTPAQLERVLADYDKFDDNTKRQFRDALAKPNPFVIALLTSAANRIAPESRRQLADSIARVKSGK